MLLARKKPNLIVLPKTIDFFFVISFLYFFTLHADELQIRVATFAIRLNNLFGMALFVAMMLRYRAQFFMIHKAIAIPLIMMTLAVLVSLLFSPYKKRCFVFLFFYGMMVLSYFWLPYQMLHKFGVKRVLTSYFASFICAGFLTIPQLPRFIKTHLGTRPCALCYEPSYYALYMTPFIVMATFHYFFNQKKSFHLVSRLNLPLFFFIHLLFVLSFSSSAFVVYMMLMLVFIGLFFRSEFKEHRREIRRFIIAVGSITGLLVALFTKYILAVIMKVLSFKYLFYHHSFRQRLIANEATWHTFLKKPLTGVGLGGFPHYRFERWLAEDPHFVHYKSKEVILSDYNPLRLFESANVFLEMLASLGIGGCLITAAFCISFCYLAKKASKIQFMWSVNFFLSTLIMLIILQISQGLLRTYVWVHVALAFAYFVKTIQSSEQAPLQEVSVQSAPTS